MHGCVYQLVKKGHYDNKPHLHVVVLEMLGSNECLVVPAFSDDKFKINELIEALKRQGYREDQICVPMNNAAHIEFLRGFSGKNAFWLTRQNYRLSIREINSAKKVGTMDDAGIVSIAKGILTCAETNPHLYSKNVIKQLNRICSSLTPPAVARTTGASVSPQAPPRTPGPP